MDCGLHVIPVSVVQITTSLLSPCMHNSCSELALFIYLFTPHPAVKTSSLCSLHLPACPDTSWPSLPFSSCRLRRFLSRHQAWRCATWRCLSPSSTTVTTTSSNGCGTLAAPASTKLAAKVQTPPLTPPLPRAQQRTDHFAPVYPIQIFFFSSLFLLCLSPPLNPYSFSHTSLPQPSPLLN